MSATTAVVRAGAASIRPATATPLRIRLRTRLHRHRLDKELASGADPNVDPLCSERARQLPAKRRGTRIAASLERLLAEADSAPRALSSGCRSREPRSATRAGTSRASSSGSKAPAYISPQGMAMLSLLIHDGAGALYGNRLLRPGVYAGRLAAVVDAIDHGPVIVTV